MPSYLLADKRHIVKYEIVLPTVNTANIHHIVISECLGAYNGTPAIPPHESTTDPLGNYYCSRSFGTGWVFFCFDTIISLYIVYIIKLIISSFLCFFVNKDGLLEATW